MTYRRRRARRIQRYPSGQNIVPKLLLLAGIILVVIFFLGDHGVYRLYEMKSEKKRLLAEIERMEKRQEELKEEEQKLKIDTAYIEKLARDLHRMALPKEKVFKTLPRSDD